MLTNEITLNIYLLAFIIVAATFAGFSFRASLIVKSRNKIHELEREILTNYATILDLEKETSNMASVLQDMKSPVIAMKAVAKEERPILQKNPDISLRKRLLSKENLNRTGLG